MTAFTKRFVVVVQLHNTRTGAPESFTVEVRSSAPDRAITAGLNRYRVHAQDLPAPAPIVVGATVAEQPHTRRRGVGH